uniref:Uncharacterized protein n=1 Tax=Rhizophora mucronata TaxID=61149 RepID=A0A2P2QGA9_RHIMU
MNNNNNKCFNNLKQI